MTVKKQSQSRVKKLEAHAVKNAKLADAAAAKAKAHLNAAKAKALTSDKATAAPHVTTRPPTVQKIVGRLITGEQHARQARLEARKAQEEATKSKGWAEKAVRIEALLNQLARLG
jgi:hypothetical protein